MGKKAVLSLIGTGSLAQREHLPNMWRLPNVKIKWICDLNENLLENFGRKYSIPMTTTDYCKVLEDPEVQGVVIATKEDAQASLTIEALKAGKHVYVEKPLANTEEECWAVCEAQEKAGKNVMVGFNRRFAPSYVKAKELIDRSGGAFNIHYRMSDGLLIEQFENKKNKPRPWERPAETRVLYELCHMFDLFGWFSGSPVKSVYCVSCRPNDEIYALTMASGCVATLMHSSYASSEIPKERLEVVAGKGAVTVDGFVELRAFGIEWSEPVYRFAGNSHPDVSPQGKYMMKELGAEAMYAMRHIAYEVKNRIRELVSDVNDLPELSLDRQALTADIKAEFREKQELIDYYMDLIFFWEHTVDKGWMSAINAFADAVITGQPCSNAAKAQDGLHSSMVGHAAMKSRETGKVVYL
jgi:predicted dehydrogenase